MTIDKAIINLTILRGAFVNPLVAEIGDSIQLGIEALKRIKWLKQHPAPFTMPLLPGETEE